MRVSRIIKSKELWGLLNEIKKIDEQTFIACLLGAYSGARFRELKSLTIQELNRERIHLGTQIYLGTGRSVLLIEEIRTYIRKFCDKQPNNKQTVLERVDGTTLKFIEANQIVIKAANHLNLKDITITSFRKSFGHNLSKILQTKFEVLDATGFKTNSKTNLHTMFDLEKGGWE